MPEMGERVAVLETKMKSIQESLQHLDTCVDSLKKTVWKAAGAVAAVIAIIELALRF